MSMANENREPFDGAQGQVNWRVIVGIVIAALSLIFILQNTEQVDIDFLVLSVEVGMWLGLLVAFALGAVLGWGLHMAWRRRKRNRGAETARKK